MSKRCPNFIIAGVNKAGTTSVYNYLNAHPSVCGSSKKETRFFTREFTGDAAVDKDNYSRYFSTCSGDHRIVFEATPGYLASREPIAARIHTTLPDTKLLFILRNPVEILYSNFNYRQGIYRLPESLSFDEYVDKCMRFHFDRTPAAELGIEEGQLRLLETGNYVDYLEEFHRLFPEEQIKIMFFEQLKSAPVDFMKELSRFLDIDGRFYEAYEFARANQTFHAKHKLLHKAMWALNGVLEPFSNRHVELKQRLLSYYKKFNEKTHQFEKMSAESEAKLQAYYRDKNLELAGRLGDQPCPSWVTASAEAGRQRQPA